MAFKCSRQLYLLYFALYMLIICCRNSSGYSRYPLVLLISFDGFRWNYLEKAKTPFFDQIIKSGVHARRGIKNVFPTKTYPNHHTIVTGLYPESHGIIGNSMFDPKFNEAFHYLTKDPKWFSEGGDPLWVMNQRKNPERRSGGLYWPGTAVKINGVLPYKYADHEPRFSNITRCDRLVEWYTDDQPINFGVAHFGDADHIGHDYGPETPEMAETVAKLDTLAGYLLKKLRGAGLLDKMDIVITSDHGMTTTPIEKLIDLDKYVDPSSYRMFGNLISGVVPNEGVKAGDIYNKLKYVPHLTVYHKEDIPERFHYKHSRRVAPLLLMPDIGYSITHNKSKEPKADHGYDNEFQDMHPFFLAMGPSFKQGYSVKSFDTVDIYPLLCHLLKLDPAPNNGSLNNVRDLLREDEDNNSTFLIYILIVIFIATISSIFSVVACRQRIHHTRQKYTSLAMISSHLQSDKTNDSGGQDPLLMESETEEEF